MAARPPVVDLQGYDGSKFEKIVTDLHKTCVHEITRSKQLLATLNNSTTAFDAADERDLQSDIKALTKDRVRFIGIMKALNSGGKVSVKEIETGYDSYCYSLAMLGAHIDKWEAVTAGDFVKKVLANVTIIALIYKKIGSASKDIEKALKALEKARKKAEKAKYKSYIKAGLSVALDVAILVSPHVRAMSAMSKLVVGQTIGIGSTMLLGKPEDFAGQSLGITVTGAEIVYKAQDYRKSAKALGLAGKAMSIDGYVGSVKEIKDARAAVDQIEAKMAELKRALEAKAKFMEKMAKEFESAKGGITYLVKRVQANSAKAGNARAQYQTYKALRDNL
jgi:hypothetical protein